jgi:DNA-binding LytR/AlgR family response regulator
MLPADAFLRIHRSYIVSLNKIDSYNAETIEIAKKELPIGRLYKHDVTKFLNASSLQKEVKKNIRDVNE